MTGAENPDNDGNRKTGQDAEKPLSDQELGARTRALETALSTRRKQDVRGKAENTSSTAGYAQALRLSSEFIAGIVVGAFIGWMIDTFAGTSPWGFIVFILLGFCAGVLNVVRSAGLVAENEITPRGGSGKDDSGDGSRQK